MLINKHIKNNYNFGRLTFLVLKEENKFTGVCLEFDLIVRAPTPEEAREHIEDLASGWLKNVVTNRLPEELLNKRAPEKYWKVSEKIDKEITTGKNMQPLQSRTTGVAQKPSPLLFSITQNYFGNNLLA